MTPSPPDAAPDDLDHAVAAADAFVLDPAVVHLNHGSFGACPRAALDVQAAWRARLEAATMRFFVLDGQPALDDARAEVAGFVGADPAGLVFVANATAGVATALDGLVGDGDEVVTIDHGYAACRHGLERLVARRGGRVVTAHVAFPVRDPAQHVDAIVAACTPETRVVLLDHVTSPTALILDVAAIARALAPRGVHVVVDGAHAPGMLDLDVAALAAAGVAAYVGNLHKWACAPKACALLWVRDDLRRRIRPLVTSHGAALAVDDPRRFHAEHDWTGTHDPTPYLSAPAAIAAIAAIGGGWPAVRARGHRLAIAMRDVLLDALGGAPAAPDAMLGMMASLPIAPPAGVAPRDLERGLLEAGWEVAIAPWPRLDQIYLRVSAHVYNRLDDARRLAAHLRALGIHGAAE